MAANKPDFSLGRVDLPDVGGGLLDFADRQQKQYQIGLGNAVEADKLLRDTKQKEFDNLLRQESMNMQKAQAARQEDQYKRELTEKSATNEAVSAMLDPKKYQAGKIAGEQNAIEQSLSALSPAERVIAEQQIKANYNPAASGAGWLSSTMSNADADQSKLLSTQNSLLNMRLNDPNSEEYKAKQAADWAEYTKKQNYAQGLQTAAENRREAKDAKKVQSMFDLLSVQNTVPTQVIANEAQIKNIGNKQEVFGDAYVKRYAQNAPSIKALENTIASIKADTTRSDESKQIAIDSAQKSLDSQLKGVENYALGIAGMGAQMRVLPEPEYKTVDSKISKEAYITGLRKQLGDKPSPEAITLAYKEIGNRYPDVDPSVLGFNTIAQSYGGNAVTTNDPKVAEFNAKLAADIKKEQIKAGAKKVDTGDAGSINKTYKALDNLFESYGSPDVIGMGQEDNIKLQMAAIQSKYGATDTQLADIIPKLGPIYNSAGVGVDHNKLERNTENMIRALKNMEPLKANEKLAREK